MAVTPTSPTPTVTPASAKDPNATAKSLSSLTNNFQTFLALLTTQLKNQDPLSPLDSNQFTQQLVQMSGVEQQIQTNALLQTIAGNTGTGVSTAVSLIGKDVRAVTNTAALNKGQAAWTYNLPDGVADLKLEVVDSAGKVVQAVAPADLKPGDHAFTWNGKDAGGAQLPDGTYSLKVTALDSGGKALTTTTYVDGIVSGVQQSNGQTLLTINGGQVPWTAITTISQPTTPSAPTPTSTATGG